MATHAKVAALKGNSDIAMYLHPTEGEFGMATRSLPFQRKRSISARWFLRKVPPTRFRHDLDSLDLPAVTRRPTPELRLKWRSHSH